MVLYCFYLMAYTFLYETVLLDLKGHNFEEEGCTKRNVQGVRASRRIERIVGGKETPISDAPYMAALLIQGWVFCGGCIVSIWHVVSSAYCLFWVTTLEGMTIRIGSSHYDEGGQERNVSNYTIHDKFMLETDNYDCSVLKVDAPFDKTQFPFKELPLSRRTPKPNEIVLVSGWGSDKMGGPNSKNLKSVNITVLPKNVCMDYFAKFKKSLPYTAFCAGNLEGGSGTCTGDMGGPAVRHNKLTGIVAWGSGCGAPNVPSAYTDIKKVRKWIKKQIKIQ